MLRKLTIGAFALALATSVAAEETLDLGGTWKISFSDQSDFKDADFQDSEWQAIEVPSNWGALKNHKGVAWLRNSFQLPPGFPRMSRALAFQVHDQDETYVNGVLIGKTGIIGEPDSHAYGLRRVYFVPPEILREGSNTIAVRIQSSLEGHRGIVQGQVQFGALHALEKERALSELKSICFGAVYLTAGLYFLLFFLRLPKIRTHFYFAVFCLFLACYILLRAEAVSDFFGFLQAKRIEYMLLFILPIPFLVFWASLFQYKQPWYVLLYYVLLASFVYFPASTSTVEIWRVALGKWYILFGLGVLCILFLLVQELRRGSPLARVLLAGTLLFLLSILNDVLEDRGLLRTVRISEYGFLAFVCSMAASLVQSFVQLQRKSQETLQRLMEMDQLKERLVSNATEVLLSPAALILSAARRLRGRSLDRSASDYEELQRHGSEMNQALDGVLLLSRIQSGVESASFRILNASDLKRIYPEFSWPAEARILGTESLLQLLFQSGPSEDLEISWQNDAGLSIARRPLHSSASTSSLQENMIREAVKVLKGELYLRSNGDWFIQIPPASPDAPWTEKLEQLSSVRGTAIPRLFFSFCMLVVFAVLDQRTLAALQAGHLLFAIVSIGILWRSRKAGSEASRVFNGAVHAYMRTGTDLGQVSIAVFATGGLDSPWLLGFALPAVFSSLGRDSWRGRFAAAAGTLFAFLTEAAAASGVLPDINILGKGVTPTSPLQIGLHTSLIAAGLAGLAEVTHRLYASSLRAREEAHAERERAEKLNEFALAMNASPNFSRIIEQIVGYLQAAFRIDSLILLLPDETGDLVAERAFTSASVDRDVVARAQAFRVPAGPEGGIVRATFERKKPLYVKVKGAKDIFRRPYPGIEGDRSFVESLHFEWFLLVPLVVQNKAIGLVLCTSYSKQEGLDRAQISRVEEFCNQVAGAVNSAELLRQSALERDRSESLRKGADAAREEMETLAQFSRAINESADLKQILEGVFTHFKSAFGAQEVALQLVDETTSELYTVQWSSSRSLTASQTSFITNLRVPLIPDSGSLFRTYQKQKPVHIARKTISPFSSAVDRLITETLELHSVGQFPLVIQNRTIGVLWLSFGEGRRRPEQIKSIARLCDQIAGAVQHARLLEVSSKSREESDRLLANILPASIAEELKQNGQVEPLFYDSVSVLFTDFVGFTKASEGMLPDELVAELDGCFSQFDAVAKRNNMEKLKTIGDSYMCAGGLPQISDTHAIDACLTALEFRAFMVTTEQIKKSLGFEYWQIRIGLHTGSVTAGVIGTNKFAYDIWGDTVNTASRMESSGAPGMVNISGDTYMLVKEFFDCEYRGKVSAKGKGEVDMYFLNRIKPELSADDDGLLPNAKFEMMRLEIGGPGG